MKTDIILKVHQLTGWVGIEIELRGGYWYILIPFNSGRRWFKVSDILNDSFAP